MPADERPQAIAEAVAAFDGVNLAWGQFYQAGNAERLDVERARRVREALGEAALSVPNLDDRDEASIFVASVLAAREQLLELLTALPAEIVPDDMRDAPDILLEAAHMIQLRSQ